jgi:hypothetical protein
MLAGSGLIGPARPCLEHRLLWHIPHMGDRTPSSLRCRSQCDSAVRWVM